MIIDFKEIPKTNSSEGKQDTWEMFCRDFLVSLGYIIASEPSRGPDGGLDIKVKEIYNGITVFNAEIYWLVSCKHFAHSGKSITMSEETDIRDRVEANDCSGFIGLYSSIASTPLRNKLDGLRNKIRYKLFDNEKIESSIVGLSSKESMFIRYFPNSYRMWKDTYFYKEPVKLFYDYFERNYKLQLPLIKTIFYTLENSIKGFRDLNSFQELLALQGIDCILFPGLEETFYGNYEFMHNKISTLNYLTGTPVLNLDDGEKNYGLYSLLNKLIPLEVKYRFDVEIGSNHIFMAQSVFPMATLNILYPKYLVYDQNSELLLNTMFLDLKGMLN